MSLAQAEHLAKEEYNIYNRKYGIVLTSYFCPSRMDVIAHSVSGVRPLTLIEAIIS